MPSVSDALKQMAEGVLRGDAQACADRLLQMLQPDAEWDMDDGQRLHALSLLAQSQNRLSNPGEALLATAQRLQKLARETAAPVSRQAQACADCWFAYAYRKLKLREDAAHHALAAIREARELGDLALESRALMIASLLEMDRGELDMQREWLIACESRARAAGNLTTLFWAINNHSFIAVQEAEKLAAAGDQAGVRLKLAEAAQLIERAREVAHQSANREHEAYVLTNQGAAHMVEGNLAMARQAVEAYAVIARSLGLQRLLACAMIDEARILRAEGRLEEALALINAHPHLGDQSCDVDIILDRWTALYELHKQREDWEQALHCHEQIASQREKLMAEESARLQRVLLARLDLEQAQAMAERAQLEAQAERLRAQAIERERDEHRRAALVDPLTQLGNRRALEQDWPEHEARAQREAELLFVAILDVDHFKQVNDRFGHAVGDRVLSLLSQQALALLRRRDGIYRLGGEEILVVLSDSSPWAGFAAGERLRKGVETVDWASVAEGLVVTISLGVATQRPGDTLSTLMERADEALYRAKNSGRNRCEQD